MTTPARQPRAPRLRALGCILALALAGPSAANGVAVLNVLAAAEGLPALHVEREGGTPVMPLPQFRLFDGEGRQLWSFSYSLPRGFARELERRLENPAPVEEARSFAEEARFFLRRGGLPLNLKALPSTDFTIVEYWADECGACKRLSREVDKFFAKRRNAPVKILRVYVEF